MFQFVCLSFSSKDDYYITKDNSQAIPIRWLGPEVIELLDDGTVKTKKITKESNIW